MWSFPLCVHVLNKPLDSGLRRNDGGDGFRFSPDGYGHSRRLVADTALPPASLSAVIPAKAGIQEGGAGCQINYAIWS